MSGSHEFKAIIENAGDGGAFVRVPFDVEAAFGKKRVKIKALINGVPYRGSLVRMGMPEHVLIILKEIRAQIGKTFGEEVEVNLEEDNEPRLVELPPDFQQALEKDPAARAAFEGLAYSHKREHVRAILEARRPETRQKRIEQALETLKKKD
jgi:hypothetical protein